MRNQFFKVLLGLINTLQLGTTLQTGFITLGFLKLSGRQPLCRNRLILLLLGIFACLAVPATAQTVVPFTDDVLTGDSLVKHMVKIDRIFIKGNKKTKEYIIKREIGLEEGDLVAYEDLEDLLKKDRQRILNTRLFLKVEITAIPLSNRLYDIIVEVSERWYIVAAPVFQLADRNFNDWWVNQERDLSRVNIGGRFTHYNFRGRGEKLALYAHFGFSRRYSASYYVPYIDPTRKNGLGISVNYSENMNISILTREHKREFLGTDTPLQENYGASIRFNRRASFYNTHTASVSFSATNIKDFVLEHNPDYLRTGSNSMRYFNLSYSFRRDLRDAVNYPLRGFMVNAAASKVGLGIFNDINLFNINASYSAYAPVGEKFFFSNALTGRLSTPEVQPYLHLTGLGYGGNYIRGYELYVIEGQHHVLNKSEFKFQLFKEELSLGNLMPLDQFRVIPLALYPKVYFDAGYVFMPISYPTNETLTNRPLWGGGFGLDFVSFYDMVVRMEYSFNSIGERGFFLHFAAGI